MRCSRMLAAALLLVVTAAAAQTAPAAAPIERTVPARTAPARTVPASTVPPSTVPPSDAALEAATALLGRALFLRCFCADNNLSFDAQAIAANSRATDWTLAAVDVKTAERRSPAVIELTGVRVAMRFAADRREWERHPQADEKIRITIADPGEPRAFARLLDRIFAQGIDPRLQRAMPSFWQHYFLPQLAWTNADGRPDALSSSAVAIPSAPGAADAVTPAEATHKTEPAYTAAAQRDHVKGSLTLRLVVDASGVPQRVTVYQPLGYGLDAATVDAVERYRFTPGTRAGQPVAVAAQITQEFVLVAVPR